MEQKADGISFIEARQSKLQELQLQRVKLKELNDELEKLNEKIQNKEKISLEDTKYIGNLGWLTALSVSIAAIASSV